MLFPLSLQALGVDCEEPTLTYWKPKPPSLSPDTYTVFTFPPCPTSYCSADVASHLIKRQVRMFKLFTRYTDRIEKYYI